MEEYITKIAKVAERLSLDVDASHYEENAEYYWNQRSQINTVIDKGIPDDKLMVIFKTHLQKTQKETVKQYPPMKVMATSRFSVWVWA
jgi:hypothetical protein